MSNEPLTIREPVDADLPAIAHLMAELGYPVEEAFVHRQLQGLAEAGTDWLYVAVQGDLPVGLIGYHEFLFYHLPGRYGRITVLVVTRECRRQGIGKALVDFIEAFARGRGAVRLELCSAWQRADAHAFYERLGYACDSKRFVKPLV